MKFKTAATALLMFAVAAIVPACEINRDCNPFVEDCVVTNNPPSTLADPPF